jgi:hypothetical protein
MRQTFLLSRDFFWDGPMYTLGSSSFGGRDVTAQQAAEALRAEEPTAAQALVDAGVLLPLVFEGDCMLDKAALVLGELTDQERREWVGRIRTRLAIPCGQFVLLGGGSEAEDYDAEYSPALQHLQVPPGEYDVEVLFYVGSFRAGEFLGEDVEALQAWCAQTRPGEPEPRWLEMLRKDEFFDRNDLVGTLIHLAPASGPARHAPVDHLQHMGNFVAHTELRRPEVCPAGLSRYEFEQGARRLNG